MSQPFIAQNPHQLQAHLLTVTTELLQLEASLLRLRDSTERLRAAYTVPGQESDPLEKMYEDLERAIRDRPAPDTALSGHAALNKPASEPPRKARVRLRVVPVAPADAAASAAHLQ